MNIIRVIPTQNASTRNRTLQVSKQRMIIVMLIITLFFSAFGLVYFKDLYRRLFIQYQILQRGQTDELMRWEKLLLEQTTWSAQSRIQRVAEQQLGMKLPSAREIVLVNTKMMTE